MGRISVWGLFFFAITIPAWAYTPTVTTSGHPVRWPGGSIHFELAGNPGNQSGLSQSDFYSSVVHGLQRWSHASGGSVGFDYWQGTDPATYPSSSSYDGLSAIYFVSQAAVDPHLSRNVLGLTQVWYDASSGRILEADIALNDRDFHFTTQVKDTSGYGSGSPTFSGGKSSVFVENVITHELGHALGLSHSGGLQSTMLFMESPEQAHLSCDESVGIHALYPNGDAGTRGTITGRVVNENGAPVMGAHVLAISRKRGYVLASTLADQSGRYSIAALEPGTYFLMVEPFYAGPQTLPSYYGGMRFDFCGGRPFGRTVLTDASGYQPEAISVEGGRSVEAPPITARCRNDGGAAISAMPASSTMRTAPTLYPSSNSGDTGFGGVDQLNPFGASYYRLRAVNGRVEIHALNYSLYSPVRTMLSLFDSSGNKVAATSLDNIYQGDSGYVNFDSALYADSLPMGDYVLKVSSVELDATLYPAGTVSLDQVPFLVITGSINESSPSLVSTLPDNARCQMAENFASYSSPPGNPPRHQSESNPSTGFCATLSEDSKRGGGKGPGAAEIAGWFFPFFLMGAFARVLRQTRVRATIRT